MRHQRRHAAVAVSATSSTDVLARSGVRIGIHCQDDTGCAVANTIAAVEAGATHVQCTANGYGERTGNADLFSVVANLELKTGHAGPARRPPAPRWCGCRTPSPRSPTSSPTPTSRTSGSSAFAHKAGLHASALKVTAELYNHVDAAVVGNDMRVLVTEMAGRASVELKGRELGYRPERRPRRGRPGGRPGQGPRERGLDVRGGRRVLRAAAARGDWRGRDVGAVPRRVLADHRRAARGRRGRLRGHRQGARRDGERVDRARARATGRSTRSTTRCAPALATAFPELDDLELVDYKVRILEGSTGTGAVTRVLIDTSDGEREWTTVGVHENVIAASWLALEDAVEYGLLGGATGGDHAPAA